MSSETGPPLGPAVELNADLLRPSAAVLGAHIALAAAIETHAVAATGHDPTTLDLLTRLALADNRRLRAVELCRQLRLSPSHVSRMLDRAEEAGLVRREPDPDDRRAHQISMTDEGWTVIAQFAPLLEALVQDVIYAHLDETEIEALIASLATIEQAASTYTTERAGADDA